MRKFTTEQSIISTPPSLILPYCHTLSSQPDPDFGIASMNQMRYEIDYHLSMPETIKEISALRMMTLIHSGANRKSYI